MGSHMKRSIFEDQTAKALEKWQKAAKKRSKMKKKKVGATDHGNSVSISGFISAETTPSRGSLPLHLLQKYSQRSNQPDIESVVNSPRSMSSYPSDIELSDLDEGSTHHQESITIHEHQAVTNNNKDEHPDANDFSFVKPLRL